MTLADHGRAYLMALVGRPYLWAGVPDDDEVVNDSDDYPDCSGTAYGLVRHLFRLAGLAVPISRDTANDYYHMSEDIAAPSVIGWDFGYKLNAGTDHAHHIICYAGKDDTVDARGKDYGVLHEKLSHWGGEVHWRRLRPQYRIPADKLGELTGEALTVKWRVSLIGTKANARAATVYASTLGLAPGLDVFSKTFTENGKEYVAWAAIAPSYDAGRKMMEWLEGRKVVPRYAEVITKTTSGVSLKLHDLIANFPAWLAAHK